VNKTELVDVMAEKSGLTKKQAGAALESFVDVVQGTLADGGQVVLVGFGTFGAKQRSARKGTNPKTGAPIDIQACVMPNFKAGKLLKEACNSVINEID
jgi:DNA-binding protein HU-beta